MKNFEKMLQQISAIVKVEETRSFFANVLDMPNICIGGSAALLLAHNIYLDRPVHDIDVILSKGQFDTVLASLSVLSKYFEFERKAGSSYYKDKRGYLHQKSATFVLKDGLEINILVGNHPEGEWQSLQEIVAAKKRYNRPKDKRDLAIIFG